jgi:hypothetical protein
MHRFARIVLGYHGCAAGFAAEMFSGAKTIAEWKPSAKSYDWLGRGIYFWEHSPERAMQWARARHGADAAVIGAVIQLGNCFDLTDVEKTRKLKKTHARIQREALANGEELPTNEGGDRDLKRRALDCRIISNYLDKDAGDIQTVRCAFWEGPDLYEGAMLREQTHIQIAVRDSSSILGIFHPVGLS